MISREDKLEEGLKFLKLVNSIRDHKRWLQIDEGARTIEMKRRRYDHHDHISDQQLMSSLIIALLAGNEIFMKHSSWHDLSDDFPG